MSDWLLMQHENIAVRFESDLRKLYFKMIIGFVSCPTTRLASLYFSFTVFLCPRLWPFCVYAYAGAHFHYSERLCRLIQLKWWKSNAVDAKASSHRLNFKWLDRFMQHLKEFAGKDLKPMNKNPRMNDHPCLHHTL